MADLKIENPKTTVRDTFPVTRDLADLREKFSHEGSMDMRDYYKRSAAELRELLRVADLHSGPSEPDFPRAWRSPGWKIGHENREAVRRFFATHIGCTNFECAAALDLSVMAVGRHVATLRKEWTA
jgi:hypothetical protein